MRLLLKYAGRAMLAALLTWLLCLAATAQNKIARVEYYFDTDPGFGNATTATITAADSISNAAIKIIPSAFATGLHTLFVRARSTNGVWGQDVKWLFIKPYAATALYALKQVEYYLDKDPGFGNATATSVAAPLNDSFANSLISINPTTLSQGPHTLFIRARNANGTWGHDVRWLFVKPYTAATLYTLKQVEYYIDKDPGFGQATAVTLTGPLGDSVANALINIRTDTLAKGEHTLFVRALNANSTWGQDVKLLFINSVLPLTLLSFTGEMQHSTAVLNWQTTNEINTQSFTVECSADGVNYSALGSVPATDAPGINNYSFTDAKPLEGDNYYRLKMYDKDGAFTYSRIVVLNNGGGAFAIQVYPNPAATSATIAFNSLSAGKYSVTVAGMDGKTVKRIEGVAVTGANGLQLDISGLAGGVYLVTFNSPDGMHTLKLVKE